jgi:hypothetical protein
MLIWHVGATAKHLGGVLRAVGGDGISGAAPTTERDPGFADSLLEESGFEPSVPLGEKRSFRNASIRELDRGAYRGGRKRYRRGRPSGSRRSDQ